MPRESLGACGLGSRRMLPGDDVHFSFMFLFVYSLIDIVFPKRYSDSQVIDGPNPRQSECKLQIVVK